MFTEMEFKEELVHMYNLSSEFLVNLSDSILILFLYSQLTIRTASKASYDFVGLLLELNC